MLSAEEIILNYQKFKGYIETYINPDRAKILLGYYESIEEHLLLAPASSTESFHNAFEGGYIDHVNRVVEFTLKFHEVWKSAINVEEQYTLEELVFVALHHDLGKVGLGDQPNYLPNDNDWAIRTLGQKYKINPVLPFATIPDRSLFILQNIGITLSENEYLGIKLHDGLFEEANKPYYISFKPESRLRTVLPYIIHQGDLMASRVEWENSWFTNFRKNLNKAVKKVDTKSKVKVPEIVEEFKKVVEPTLKVSVNNKFSSLLNKL